MNRGLQYQIAIDKLKGDTPIFLPKCKKCKSVLLIDNFRDKDINFLVRYTCPICSRTKLIKNKNNISIIDFDKKLS